MAKNYHDITLALAGICQAARLVQDLAHHGRCDDEALNTSINSILNTNPSSTVAIFGHERKMKIGYEGLLYLLNASRGGASAELARYALSIIMLSRKLANNSQAMSALASRIKKLNEHQLAHFEVESDNAMYAIAGIYADVISPLGAKIQIVGKTENLTQPLIQAKVRAILLAGIRAAVLWQQVGGNRWQFIFSRNRLINTATHVLKHC